MATTGLRKTQDKAWNLAHDVLWNENGTGATLDQRLAAAQVIATLELVDLLNVPPQ